MNCNKVPLKDKGCHFIAGIMIVILLSFVLPDFRMYGILVPGTLSAFVITVLIGAWKEGYDLTGDGDASFFDFFATALGAVAGVFTYGFYLGIIK